MATRATKLVSALFLVSIFLQLAGKARSDQPCAYPCYPPPRRQWNYGYSSDDHAAFSNRVVFASQLPPSTGRVLPVHPSATLWRRFLCSPATQLHHAVLPVLLPEAPGSDGVVGIVSPRINGHGCWDWPDVFVLLNSEPSLVVELSFSFTP
ncbi:hypothetical protein NL676_032001 [Syzygium grande]|nr:hypothetical protein NL676_032001 [Syzygium grande]